MTRIRPATKQDRDDILAVYTSAFPEGEAQPVADLADKLLYEVTSPETFSLVAEDDGMLTGAVAFSPVFIEANNDWQGYILAPLGVKSTCQKSGIGSRLVESGIKRLKDNNVDVLFVYGDPQYYGRFGFNAEAATNYIPPYDLEYPLGWQALVLHKNIAIQDKTKISCVASLSDPELW